MEKITCPFCEKKFQKNHGNQLYCSSECKKNKKAAIQKKLYKLISQFRKGFLTNYKVFELLVKKGETKSYPFTELRIKGFKETCYFETFADDEKRIWYRVECYLFSIIKKENNYTVTIKCSAI